MAFTLTKVPAVGAPSRAGFSSSSRRLATPSLKPVCISRPRLVVSRRGAAGDEPSSGRSDAEAQEMIMAGGSIPDSKSPYAGGKTPSITDEQAKAPQGSEELAAAGSDAPESKKGGDVMGVDMLPHTGRQAPMSEDKRSAVPQQGGAPEADKAIIGQLSQPGVGGPADTKPTPEDRYGSKEAYEEAKEAAKDRTRKSELQTGDEQAGAYSEGSA